MPSRRAILYMPGNDFHKIKKATTLGVDSICMDLEDGVAPIQKPNARNIISSAMHNLDFGISEKLIRVNPVSSSLSEVDINEMARLIPDGIVIPKIEHTEEVKWVSKTIGDIEKELHLQPNQIKLLVIIETALAMINLREIAGADPRIDALIFGAEDLIAAIGGKRTGSGHEVVFARSAVVTYAAAFGLQAIDMVNLEFIKLESLHHECQVGVELGYTGKQIIHPNQVEIVQNAFTPSDDEIEHAIQIITTFEQQTAKGIGAYSSDGKLIDAPVIKIAKNTIEKARAANKIS